MKYVSAFSITKAAPLLEAVFAPANRERTTLRSYAYDKKFAADKNEVAVFESGVPNVEAS